MLNGLRRGDRITEKAIFKINPLCPNCNSKEIEVDIFDANNDGKNNYTRVWRLKCRECGFDKIQPYPFFCYRVENNLI